jgi:hypothetical protein
LPRCRRVAPGRFGAPRNPDFHQMRRASASETVSRAYFYEVTAPFLKRRQFPKHTRLISMGYKISFCFCKTSQTVMPKARINPTA